MLDSRWYEGREQALVKHTFLDTYIRLHCQLAAERADADRYRASADQWQAITLGHRDQLKHCQPRDPKTGRLVKRNGPKSAHTAPHSANMEK